MAGEFIAEFLTAVGNSLVSAAKYIVNDFIRVIPGLIGAAVLLSVGIFIGKYVKQAVEHLLMSTQIDEWLHEKKLKEAIGNHHLASILGSFAKWYVIIVFLAQSLALIQMRVLHTFAEFLVGFVNSLLAALIILIGTLLVARYMRNVIEATDYRYKRTIAIIVEVLVMYAGVVMSLRTVGVDTRILSDAFIVGFTVLVVAVAIMAGIVFALAFKKDIIQLAGDLKKEIGK